ncbi:hypothetical protein GCM10009718_26970 [Isoptericola halotolerans]|uniref:DUF4038 domain-containing protein n=1 Tax=Isoptericola halotolerans TaxID=300560 RepID=A0ABX2A457_9MICO|nr:DUF4038 domain-containing protein [Isoptericola halotolerans]NOV97449.1 hypothetical protein [Isoptericola halotolerans]
MSRAAREEAWARSSVPRPLPAALSRRDFLGLAGAASGLLLLSACSGGAEPMLPEAAVDRWTQKPGALVAGVSADGRALVDDDGDPVLVLADTVWSMTGVYTSAEVATYFATRREQGFNGVQISSLPFHIDGENRVEGCVDGQQAFVDGDVTRFDEGYWRRLDEVLETAAAHGTTVLLGAMGPLVAYGIGDLDQCHEFGRLLGERYGGRPGIIWLFGVDYGSDLWDDLDPHLLACLDGIRAAGDEHPATIQYHNNSSLSSDNPRWVGRTDVEAAYSYAPTYAVVRKGYELAAGPVVLVESNYEDENNTQGPDTTDESIRRQALWTYTSGGVYVAYGRRDVWSSQGDYLDALTSTAVTQLGMIRARLETLDWPALVPDLDGSVLVEGAGEDVQHGSQLDGTADVLESDLATCAAAPDGSLTVVYVPSARPVRLAPGFATGAAQWWDPTTGESHEARLDGSGMYVPPDDRHADRATDWLLVVEA